MDLTADVQGWSILYRAVAVIHNGLVSVPSMHLDLHQVEKRWKARLEMRYLELACPLVGTYGSKFG